MVSFYRAISWSSINQYHYHSHRSSAIMSIFDLISSSFIIPFIGRFVCVCVFMTHFLLFLPPKRYKKEKKEERSEEESSKNHQCCTSKHVPHTRFEDIQKGYKKMKERSSSTHQMQHQYRYYTTCTINNPAHS